MKSIKFDCLDQKHMSKTMANSWLSELIIKKTVVLITI